MATVDFVYDYPYISYGENGRFQYQWSESSIWLNGCYTYPIVFNSTVPGCRHIKVNVVIENTGYSTVCNREWDFMMRKSNGQWYNIQKFTMPESGVYTVDCDVPNIDVSMFAFVPSYNPGSGYTWTSGFGVERLTITETAEVKELSIGRFQYGVFANCYGVSQTLNEVQVNIDGVLVPATEVLVNVGGTLRTLQPVYSAYHISESDSMVIYSFRPDTDGVYRIRQKDISGDHELRIYSSDFTPLYDTFFYNKSFELTAGALYYITITHYYCADKSESYLQIYKED